MGGLTGEERESYWYGTVGCKLCPCGQNPELHKINNHQVDTVLLTGLQTDHEVEDPASQQPTRTDISASYTYVTYSSLCHHLQRLALDMSSVITLYIVDYDSMLSGPIDHSEG